MTADFGNLKLRTKWPKYVMNTAKRTSYSKVCWLYHNQEITHFYLFLHCMKNLVIFIFFSRDHKSSSKSHHKSSHSHGSSSKDHHKDRHADKRKHGSSSSSSKHHHKSAKKSRRWILESYQARIHFSCLKKIVNLFLTIPPHVWYTY